MKMYDTPNGSFPETNIDPNFRDAGLADGSIIERDATPEETLAECYRQREAAYPPVSQLADAVYHQQQGDSSQMQTYVGQVAAVKNQFPKPATGT